MASQILNLATWQVASAVDRDVAGLASRKIFILQWFAKFMAHLVL